MTIVLIDTSSFIFRHIHATRTYYCLSQEVKEVNMDSQKFKEIMIKNYHSKVQKLLKKYQKSQILFCYDGKLTRTWRYKIYPIYKKQRKSDDSLSKLFKILFDITRAFNDATHFKIRDVEADDLIAVLTIQLDKIHNFYNSNNEIHIVTDDSDIFQLVGYCLKTVNLIQCNLKSRAMDATQAQDILKKKIQKGDPSDNIKSAKTNGIELNTLLIDFRKIPEDITRKIIDNFNKLNPKTIAKRKLILELPPVEKATVLFRPSKKVKSPYLADINLLEKEYMAHTPALSMSGMIDTNSEILVSTMCKPKKATHCIQLVKHVNEWVGALPLKANGIAKEAIQNGWLGINAQNIKCEYKIDDSRIDFFVTDTNGTEHLIEIKSVILKDNKTAYFPDGYKKKKGEPVSERALKHAHLLQKYALSKKGGKSHLIYIIQRYDVDYFRIFAERDPIYARAVWNAIRDGVNVQAYKVKWDPKKGCSGWKSVPIVWWLE